MHSLRGWKLVVCGGMIVAARAVPAPVITPAPVPGANLLVGRQNLDAASFAEVLLTAIPLSLRQIAATNPPAVSSILWSQFLDDDKPQWFLDLPSDIQSYLIVQYGPETAWPTSSPSTSGASTTSASSSISSSTSQSPSPSASTSLSSSTLTSRSSLSSPSASTTTDPDAPPAVVAGLTRRQKIGLGVGIPAGLIGAAAILFACCFLLRRRRQKRRNAANRGPSPGFVPRYAFHDKSPHHTVNWAPLNPTFNQSSSDLAVANWDDDGYDPHGPSAMEASHRTSQSPPGTALAAAAAAPMAMHDSKPIMAPVLYHTHSSNRARGKRTSYSSLHSVAEVNEPDDFNNSPPPSGRQTTPLERKRRPSMPMLLAMPPAPRPTSLKRKPIPESPTGPSAAANAASQYLLRPALKQPIDHSGSSSSGLVLSTNSSRSSRSDPNSIASPVSPLSDHPHAPQNPFGNEYAYVAYSPKPNAAPKRPWSDGSSYIAYSPGAVAAPKNPFSNDYSYVEDYGPEYQTGYDAGAYAGNSNLDRYSESPVQKSSKTEWPLKNMLPSMREKRERSPMWDRVYESP